MRPLADRQIASMPFAVLLLAPDTVISDVNAAGEQLLGQGARRLVNKPLHSVIEFADKRLIERIRDCDVQVSARDVTARIGRTKAIRLSVFVAPVIDRPGWQIMTLIENAEVEALERGDGQHGDDSALRAPEILAHEIKNPLAGIRGAAQLLSRKLRSEELALTRLIADEVDRIAALIDQMQTLNRRTPEPVSPVNLHVAIRRARAVLEASGVGPVTISEEFDPSLPEVLVSGDALMQVLLNLMTNAAEACRDVASPRITVMTRFTSGIRVRMPGRSSPLRLPIEIRVSDNGPGIDPALRDHVFEPFVTSKKTGQGLGLALVRKLVRDMDGRITHERDEETGTTHFRIHLPVAEIPVDALLEDEF